MARPKRPEHLQGLRHLNPDRIVRVTLDNIEETCHGLSAFHDEMEQADTEIFREALPRLRANQAALARFVAFVEHRAEETPPVVCSACKSRFYPSRVDARYCSGTCRMRAHRAAPKIDDGHTADKRRTESKKAQAREP